MKQAIVIRKDLKMGKGKAIAQACHASLGAYKKTNFLIRKLWEIEGEKKVVLACKDLNELKDLERKAKKLKLPCFLVIDAGKTQLEPGTPTALGIGPAKDELIDKITGKLKLL